MTCPETPDPALERCGSADPTPRDPLVDGAIRLFQFLMRAQEVRDEPARTVDAYRRDGAVLWFGDLPHHPAVRSALDEGEADPAAPFLTVDRVPRLTPPAPDDRLAEWLDLACDDPATEPRLRDSIIRPTDEVGDDGLPIGCVEHLDERPEISESFREWLRDWQAWADQEPRDRPIRDLYGELFAMYVNALGRAEEQELVIGVGCLAWTPADHPTVLRHLLTASVAIEFDDDTGRLTVVSAESVEAADVEVEMLDARLITQPQQLNESRARARDFAGNLWTGRRRALSSGGSCTPFPPTLSTGTPTYDRWPSSTLSPPSLRRSFCASGPGKGSSRSSGPSSSS
jgi:hypothetical protein